MVYDTAPLVPLSLDRVIGSGELITSTLPIFKLPTELINHVVPYLSPLDIRCLALVDRDANQLARALQFTHVKLDYSNHALQLLARLIAESEALETPSRRIGPCIRRLTVSTTRHYLNTREGIDLEDLQGLSLEERLCRIGTAKRAEANYIHSICELLPHLPNLHILDWDDEGLLTAQMMESIISSSISHLRLNGPILNTQFTVPSSHTNWPLQSLYVNIGWSMTTPTPGNTSKFMSSLLELTAPTLCHLVWYGQVDALSQACHAIEKDVKFPALRDVVLDQVGLKDSSLLDRILDKRAVITSLSIDSHPIISRFLADRGRVSSLRSLRWTRSSSSSEDGIIDFIHNNPHLSSLDVTCPLPYTSINSILIRRNQPHFDHLIALHLVSDTPEFSDETLKTVASIKSLQHLWLSAGVQYGWRYEWAVDHEYVTEILKPLLQLETLAFTRDSYRVNGHILLDTSVDRYYINKILPQNLLLNQYLTPDEMQKSASLQGTSFDSALHLRESFRNLTWERWHQSQMVMHATEYSRVFRQLKWCFLGQLPMRIDESPFWRVAEMDAEGRDPSLKSLHTHWNQIVKTL